MKSILLVALALFVAGSFAKDLGFITSCAFSYSCDDCSTYTLAPPTCTCTLSLMGNGNCDAECNTVECWYDGGDCTVPTCSSGCIQSWLGDGFCDSSCNNPDCLYDMGDCSGGECVWCDSSSTCVDGNSYCSTPSTGCTSGGGGNGAFLFLIFLPIILPVIIGVLVCVGMFICGICIYKQQQRNRNKGMVMQNTTAPASPAVYYAPPGYPQQSGYPQQPGYPQQSGYPQQPGYPGYPQQTGYPQQVPPGYPQQSAPEYPQQSAPAYPQQSAPAYPDAPSSSNDPYPGEKQ